MRLNTRTYIIIANLILSKIDPPMQFCYSLNFRLISNNRILTNLNSTKFFLTSTNDTITNCTNKNVLITNLLCTNKVCTKFNNKFFLY